MFLIQYTIHEVNPYFSNYTGTRNFFVFSFTNSEHEFTARIAPSPSSFQKNSESVENHSSSLTTIQEMATNDLKTFSWCIFIIFLNMNLSWEMVHHPSVLRKVQKVFRERKNYKDQRTRYFQYIYWTYWFRKWDLFDTGKWNSRSFQG